MSSSLHQSSVPGFIAMLKNIKGWLDKAATKKDEAVLIEARLAPDMAPLARQIQIASDGAKGAAARLTGSEPPAMPDEEASFADLKARCDKTIAYLESVDPAVFDAGADREIVSDLPQRRRNADGWHHVCDRLCRPQLLFPRHHNLRDPARARRRDRQG
jgi:hypothetical protein